MKLKELHEESTGNFFRVVIPGNCQFAKRTKEQKEAAIFGVEENDGSFIENQTIATIENISVNGNEVLIYPMEIDDVTSPNAERFRKEFESWCWDQEDCYTHMLLEKLPESAKRSTFLGSFYCDYNELTSLENAPISIRGDVSCMCNKLTSLKDIHKHIHEIQGGGFYCTRNPIKSHVLGLLKIKGLSKVVMDNRRVEAIINKYLPEGDMLACVDELEDAGLEEYAKL